MQCQRLHKTVGISLLKIMLVIILLSILLQSCSHYYLPATHLESSETRGIGQSLNNVGRFELARFQAGPDLNAPSIRPAQDPKSKDIPDPELQTSYLNYGLGFSHPINDTLDLGVRFEPYAPLLVTAQLQITGKPEASAEKGNFSSSMAAATGFLLGSSSNFWLLDLSVPTGYRFAARHVALLTPFFMYGGISGFSAPIEITSVPTKRESNSFSATQYGLGLGYQYEIEAIVLRLETNYTKGSLNKNAISGLYSGCLLGFKL